MGNKIYRVEDCLTPNAVLLSESAEGKDAVIKLGVGGDGIDVTYLKDCTSRYVSFWLEAHSDYSIPLNLLVYSNRNAGGNENSRNAEAEGAVFDITFGVLPRVRTAVIIDMKWLEAGTLFPENCPGELKVVCHGRRVDREEIDKIVITTLPLDGEIEMSWSALEIHDEYPEFIKVDGSHLPDVKLVDELGQNKMKEWSSKLHSVDEMVALLRKQRDEISSAYPFENWSQYGGYKELKLTEGTGFFGSIKKDGKWWLTDPEGYAFFSMGPDCVVARSDCRVDGLEKWCDWLPATDDPEYGKMYSIREGLSTSAYGERRRTSKLFSFEQANLYRAFGNEWYEVWKQMIPGQLRKYGMNTLANWSDPELFGTTGTPYVTSLPHFPETELKLFRDFPDVLSEEYQKNADAEAQLLAARKDDPYMIGYFLRNEPAWAFVDGLIIAEEVLYNPAQSVCRQELIKTLTEKYQTIEALNAAWKKDFASFDDLKQPIAHAASFSEAAYEDMKAFSRRMLNAYVSIPAQACRKVDPNHMILGMRWAWISDPDLVTGWENFDVFSINCYSYDPTRHLQRVADLNVDLPVMIGEYHFGALDAGPCSTGLEGVPNQVERGKAYRFYTERVAAHPNGVGCHFFQCYDQFTLGRFDGENYNIGLFDICSQPYPEMMNAVKACSAEVYEVAAGKKAPTEERAIETAMIAF